MTPTRGSHGKLHRTTKILSHARRRGGGLAARGARSSAPLALTKSVRLFQSYLNWDPFDPRRLFLRGRTPWSLQSNIARCLCSGSNCRDRLAPLSRKRGGLQSETAPSLSWLLVSDFDDCDDPVIAVNDDDLITNNEVHVPAPLGMDFDERRRNLYHPDAGWHRGADADGEVDVVYSPHIPASQD